MSYTTPVTDRIMSDVTTPTSKGLFNVADWTRIYGNASHVNGLFTSEIGYTISFDTIATPTITTIPTVAALNILMGNINRMSAWAALYLADYLTADDLHTLKSDWAAGLSAVAPDYRDVNLWEQVIDTMYVLLNSWTPPTLSGNLDLGGGGSLELGGGGYLELGA